MSGIIIKGAAEIELMRQGADILGRVHGQMAQTIKPGVTTGELDKIAEEFIRDHGGEPSFKGYNGFPYSLCISVNEVVVHGFPSSRQLQEGDIISVDCGVKYKGYHTDSAFTYPVGRVSDQVLGLMRATYQSLFEGIKACNTGNRLGDVGFAIQSFVQSKGYSVVRELVGHGVGVNLHEAPEVPNYGKRGSGIKIQEGMVIAIEPMVNMGTRNIVFEKDGWTVRTSDFKPSAHYEHTVAVINGKCVPITTFEYIEGIVNI